MSTNMWRGRWYGMSPQGDAHQRAREVVRPTGTIVRGKFPSRKNGRMVDHEGLLELDAIYLFECSPEIVRYREQPLTLTYPDGHRLRRYTPDFELVLRSGEIILVEIKPTRSLVNDEVQHKLARWPSTSPIPVSALRF
ncbi:Tn7 transposase TnsA N-terminal domain-containing protein [Paludibacterium denitrificans]|uniref:Tn7 transposase TnsA N-terminal domain-containing protein n=1 Tax=Paludibacterium denitrificans TaxID=2675226 RepID=UPI001E5180B7|nr:Tn7 transposase TnsA N-terminal domain-containing protein [Paludibacterium denitrificans]